MATWQLQRRLLSLFSTRRPHSSLSNVFSDILKGQACLHDNAVPQFIGNFGTKLGCTKVKENLSPPFALSLRSFIHSVGPNEFETGRNIRSNEFETGRNIRSNEFETGRRFTEFETGRNTRSMNFVRGIIEENGRDVMVGPEYRYGVEQNADIVHVKMIRNNTFVTLTDSKGNKKAGASSGCLAEMKGGPKVSRYAAEATAEHVGRLARNMGLKSVVIKVNGFTYFKKKKQAILSFREGYTHSRGDQNPIVYIEDTTRRPHNGCRLRKKRRV